MEPLELARIAHLLAWHLVDTADNDLVPWRSGSESWRRWNNYSTVNPSRVHTETGLMMAVDRWSGGIHGLLTPWGYWHPWGSDYFLWSKDRTHQELQSLSAEKVPREDLVYNPISGLSVFDIYRVGTFGDIMLPAAQSTEGVGNALYRQVVAIYPDKFPEYWQRRRAWSAIVEQLRPLPHEEARSRYHERNRTARV